MGSEFKARSFRDGESLVLTKFRANVERRRCGDPAKPRVHVPISLTTRASGLVAPRLYV